jgi:hypothetical protein
MAPIALCCRPPDSTRRCRGGTIWSASTPRPGGNTSESAESGLQQSNWGRRRPARRPGAPARHAPRAFLPPRVPGGVAAPQCTPPNARDAPVAPMRICGCSLGVQRAQDGTTKGDNSVHRPPCAACPRAHSVTLRVRGHRHAEQRRSTIELSVGVGGTVGPILPRVHVLSAATLVSAATGCPVRPLPAPGRTCRRGGTCPAERNQTRGVFRIVAGASLRSVPEPSVFRFVTTDVWIRLSRLAWTQDVPGIRAREADV